MRLPWHAATPRLNLALQGGGAHGAFTWGVLDALLEHGGTDFDGVSGTSAGAMNAVVLAQGLMDGGRDGARQALRRFWTAVAGSLPFEVAVPRADGPGFQLAPAMRLMLQWTHYFSPGQLNPFDLNPLRDILREQLDIERLRRQAPLRLFIATTEADTGKLRLFHGHELSLDAVLASACLPRLHRSVVIEGRPHWDGGYAANPAVYPLLLETGTPDTLLVMLTPLRHHGALASVQEIDQRLQALSFSATFLREMRMVAHLRERIGQIGHWRRGPLERRLAQARFHAIEPAALLVELDSDTQAAASLKFFEMLFELGRGHGRDWLGRHHGAIGHHSTVDLGALFY